jgi:pimeloyl-ACP methyl ester carboxylesterase
MRALKLDVPIRLLITRCLALSFIVLLSAIYTSPSPANAQADIGLVLMHGNLSSNGPRSSIAPLVQALVDKGISVIAPKMPWSRSRQFDKTVDEAMIEIDNIVQRLKNGGSQKVFVAGHSLGANMALRYGATRDGIHGIIAIAPGHLPELSRRQETLARELDIARSMVAEGHGQEKTYFRDINQGKERALYMRADVYLSFHDPEGPAVMPVNASELRRNTALLWVIGKEDRMFQRGSEYAYELAPLHEKNEYLVVAGGHRATPDLAKRQIIEWMRSF